MRLEITFSRRKFLIASAGVVAMTKSAAADDPQPAVDLNAEIVKFAKSRLGEQVGDGECTALVLAAIREAGAKRYPNRGRDADYVWGTLVEKWGEAKPGDLLQFRDAVFRSKKTVRENGRTTLVTSEAHYPHHSAIVLEVSAKTKALKILHQNVGDEPDRKKVQEAVIRLGELQRGWVKIYRPVAATDAEDR